MFNRLLQKYGKFGPFVGSAILTTGSSVYEFQQSYPKLYGNPKADGDQIAVVNQYNLSFILTELLIYRDYKPENTDEYTIARQLTGDSFPGSESDSE